MNHSNYLSVSLFKGFKRHTGNQLLSDTLAEIANGKHLVTIEKLRLLIHQDKPEEAARIKRQLQGFTLSATYSKRRVAETITTYNNILILDFDKLTQEEIIRCRQQIQTIPYTLFCFLSPSGNGLKVGAYFHNTEIDHLRQALLHRQEISYSELEDYHKKMFDHCRQYYEAQCEIPVDISGSDIGRLCFMSYDPHMYVNHTAINALVPASFTVTPPPQPAKIRETAGKKEPAIKKQATIIGNPQIDCSHIDTSLQMEFQRCINNVQRNMKFITGQRDTYLYLLGNKCYHKGIPEEITMALAEKRFGGTPDIDIPTAIHNAYQYTSRTDAQEEERKKPAAVQIVDFLEKNYEIRRNIILERLEFRVKKTPPDEAFEPLRKENYNTIFLDTQYAGIHCQPHIVKTVVNSRFAKDHNPFEDYFYSLSSWDEEIDYIDRHAQTIETNNQPFWRDCFKRWLVGLVACALDDNRENQLALIIKGAQGKGKSTWIRRLLPPELSLYYRNGMLNPNNKDHMIFLSQRLLINLEEFEGMKKEEISDLKRLITQDVVTERKAYGEEAGFYIRRASFIASTNEPRFLEDITGTRRFPTVTAEKIDYKTKVNHTAIYSQALHLWRSGFRYWYEEEEFKDLNRNNMQYVVSSQEEELFYYHFRKPQPGAIGKWMPVSAILSILVIFGKINSNSKGQRAMIKILERDTFERRTTENNIQEYWVYQIV